MAKISRILFSLLFLFGVKKLSAQQGTSAAGGDASGVGGKVSYSIGQTDYQVVAGTTGTLNQGLQQPFEILVLTGFDQNKINLTCSLYPNPSSEYVYLSVPDFGSNAWRYELFDSEGKLILFQKLSSPETRISLSGLPNGNYLIRLIQADNAVKSYKIIKNQ